MAALFNQFSYLFLGLGLLAGVIVFLRWRRVQWRGTLLASIGLIAVLGGGWLVVRPGFSDVDTVQAAKQIIHNGKPTFLEFFSNYCLGCVSARPVVDALVTDIQDNFNILRIDIHTAQGRALREELGFSYSPEFILFDPTGQEVWRSNRPPTSDQLALAAPLS